MTLANTILASILDNCVNRFGMKLSDSGEMIEVRRSVRTGARKSRVSVDIAIGHTADLGLCFTFEVVQNGLSGVREIAPVSIDGAWLDGADIGDQADALLASMFDALGLDLY